MAQQQVYFFGIRQLFSAEAFFLLGLAKHFIYLEILNSTCEISCLGKVGTSR